MHVTGTGLKQSWRGCYIGKMEPLFTNESKIGNLNKASFFKNSKIILNDLVLFFLVFYLPVDNLSPLK